MAPLSRDAFVAALSRRSRAEVAAFVAALERARGRSARVEGETVVVADGSGERRLWVYDPGPLGSRAARLAGRRADPPPDADCIVTPLRDPPAAGVPVLDAGDLRDLALYGVPAAERDRLFRTHLGRSPAAAPDAATSLRTLVAVSLVALVAVGLGVGVLPDARDSDGRPGAAPVSTTPAASAATPAERFPPGLTDRRVANPAALGRAHEAALSDRSYTLRSTRTVRTSGGDLRSRLSVTVRVDERRAFLAHAETAGPEAPVFLGDPPARGAYWSNGTTYARRLTSDGERVYNTFDPVGRAGTRRYWTRTAPFGGGRAGPAETYATLFGAAETRTFVAREPNVERRHLVAAEAIAPAAVEGSDVTDVALEAEVTPVGLVRSFSLAYDATVDGDRVTVRWQITYEDVGRTAVSEPTWLNRALRGERTSANETANESDPTRPRGPDRLAV